MDARPRSFLQRIRDKLWSLIRKPFDVATSRPAIKIYLGTFLFLFTSFALLSISTTAYLFFYYNYIPQINLERQIYLQYGTGAYPYGTTTLQANALISQQPYDVSVVLHMPRTPSNLAAGNFMIDVTLFKVANTPGETLSVMESPNGSVIYPVEKSRRPAMLPYSSQLTELANTFVHLPFHLLSIHNVDSTTLTIPVFEELQFARGRANIPTHVLLQVQSQAQLSSKDQSALSPIPSPQLQIYSSKLVFETRLKGMRYVIYNHRILAFCAFTSMFYIISVSSMAIMWAIVSTVVSMSKQDQGLQLIKRDLDTQTKVKIESETEPLSQIKQKEINSAKTSDSTEDSNDAAQRSATIRSLSQLSDTPTTFPTLRNIQPLSYTPQTSSAASSLHPQPRPIGDEAADAAADDEGENSHEDAKKEEEEEEEDEMEQYARFQRQMIDTLRTQQAQRQELLARDSGIGTSLESENTAAAGSGLIRRRSGRSASGSASRGRSTPGSKERS